MARRMPQASSSLKALTITRPRQGRTRHMLGRERPPLYAPCLDRSERSSPLLHPPSKQDLPASVPALVGADQHHLSGLGLPTTLPEGSFSGGPAQTRTNQKAGGSGKASPSQNTSCVVRGVCAGAVKQRTLTSAGIRSPCRRLFSRPKLRCWKGRRAVVLAFFGIRRKFSKFMLLLKL